jgi:predicted phosphodiesterase
MLIAVFSDIHSNPCALSATIRDAEDAGVGEFWLVGDTFGYYPWAAETFELVAGRFTVSVLGNHDRMIASASSTPLGKVGVIARQNADDLESRAPVAFEWIDRLPRVAHLEREDWLITLAHGTPDDPLAGRYYPDDDTAYEWLPGAGQILILGHTHHPILRGDARDGLLLNPGSVGQPRDGDPMPSWALLDLSAGTAELRRSSYDNQAVINRLRARGWDEDITNALNRRRANG